jgi:hypothetical protein
MSLAMSDPSGGHRSAGHLLIESEPAGLVAIWTCHPFKARKALRKTGDRLISSQPVAPLVIDARSDSQAAR